MDDRDSFMISVFEVPAQLLEAGGRKVADAAISVSTGAVQAGEKIFKLLKEAAEIAEDLAREIKELSVAAAQWSDGCVGPIAGVVASATGILAAIAVFVAGVPADATGIGAIIGVPAQLAALAGIVAGIVGLLASIAALIEAKNTQLQAAKDKAAQDATNKKLQEEIDGLKANIQAISQHESNIKKADGKLRALAGQL